MERRNNNISPGWKFGNALLQDLNQAIHEREGWHISLCCHSFCKYVPFHLSFFGSAVHYEAWRPSWQRAVTPDKHQKNANRIQDGAYRWRKHEEQISVYKCVASLTAIFTLRGVTESPAASRRKTKQKNMAKPKSKISPSKWNDFHCISATLGTVLLSNSDRTNRIHKKRPFT